MISLGAHGHRRRAPILGAPFPVEGILADQDEDQYEAVFLAWAQGVADRQLLAHPGARPFDVSHFDGCSGIPDQARDCCLIHDVDYWFARDEHDRAVADARLRDNIIAKRRYDPGWQLWWITAGWAIWAGVRVAGWQYYGKGWEQT